MSRFDANAVPGILEKCSKAASARGADWQGRQKSRPGKKTKQGVGETPKAKADPS